MMIQEKAYAKINISLDVLGLLPNGYHAMAMVMQSVSLWDELEIELREDGLIRCVSGLDYLPEDEGNIAVRAAGAYLDAVGKPRMGAEIRLHKRIPVCAGLGGGSSDGAAVLRGLNRLCGSPLGRRELETLAASVGSDIPFCVAGGTQLATGSGTTLEDLPPMPDCSIVICKPPFAIRTPELFGKIDSRRSRLHPDTPGIVEALGRGELEALARRMYNVFEDVLPRSAGEIARLKGELLSRGALGSVMTGTGSALFGIFSDAAAAERACSALSGGENLCFLARPVPRNKSLCNSSDV